MHKTIISLLEKNFIIQGNVSICLLNRAIGTYIQVHSDGRTWFSKIYKLDDIDIAVTKFLELSR